MPTYKTIFSKAINGFNEIQESLASFTDLNLNGITTESGLSVGSMTPTDMANQIKKLASIKDSSGNFISGKVGLGSVAVSGGGLSKGAASGGELSGGELTQKEDTAYDGHISVSPTNIVTTQSSTDSGIYITVERSKFSSTVTRAEVTRSAFSQTVTRADINESQTAGYISAKDSSLVISSESTTVSLGSGKLNSESITVLLNGVSSRQYITDITIPSGKIFKSVTNNGTITTLAGSSGVITTHSGTNTIETNSGTLNITSNTGVANISSNTGTVNYTTWSITKDSSGNLTFTNN